MGSRRIGWIDTSKGILILIVILHHIPQVTNTIMHSDLLAFMEKDKFLYIYYFMPAFFFITGLCTNFKEAFFTFLFKNLRTLIFPAIVFGIIIDWMGLMMNHIFQPYPYYSRLLPMLLWGGDFWFLSALFVCKMLLWVEIRFFKSCVSLIIASLLLGGFGLFLKSSGFLNLWCYQNALYMNIFICIGYLIKKHENLIFHPITIGLSIASIIISLFMQCFGIAVPYIGKNINVSLIGFPICSLMAILGSLLVINAGKLMENNKVLNLFGKNTLVIYMCHIFILQLSQQYLLPFVGSNFFDRIIFASSIFVITSIVSLLLSIFVQKKTSFLLGNWSVC